MCEKIFAAANGYCGFRSYFNEIFSPDSYDRLYIIKGGPGTGKSSLMKRYAGEMESRGYEVARIYCSSDPTSLDGVISYSDGGRIGIIDGTAPHTQDTKYPGAIDIIIDLGVSFDLDALATQRESIRALAKDKSEAYKNAYYHLAAAGKIAKNKTDKLQITGTYNTAEMLSFNGLKNLSKAESDRDFIIPGRVFLTGSFSKNGYATSECPRAFSRETTHISKKGEIEDIIARLHSGEEQALALCPSPLSGELVTGILTDRCFYSIFPEELDMVSDKEYTDELRTAARYLSIASDLHFKLEEIYSPNVDFLYHTAILKRITEESVAIFDKKIASH